MNASIPSVLWFENVRRGDVAKVGGKNASLGEMIGNLSKVGVHVPGGFATTAQAFRDYLQHNGLTERIHTALKKLDVSDVKALAETGAAIRGWVAAGTLPERLEQEIRSAHEAMLKAEGGEISLAVRSSATAEDLPDASFAGQQETYLNVRGIDNLFTAVKDVFASLYNDRAIAYRVHKGFVHADVALSAGVQRMVRSDLGGSGVMFCSIPKPASTRWC